MSIDLPRPVDLYIKIENSGEVEALSGCFAPDAIVRDEGSTYEGLAAIKKWKAKAKSKYKHTVHPLQVTQRGGKTVLKAALTGKFPASPVLIEYSFVLESGKIVALEITA